MSATPRTVLTIAGSDSGGGAGIAADLRTFAAHGVHGALAATVVTAQNTSELRSAHPLPVDVVAAQIDAVLDDLDVRAVKTGLLWTREIAATVADRVDRLPALVVDPVLVSSGRDQIVSDEVVALYTERLLPAALVATPNVAEAALLAGHPIASRRDASSAAQALLSLGAPHVVVTGLLDGGEAVDVHASARGVRELVSSAVATDNVHGSGCSFAAAVASRIASGADAATAIDDAKAFVHAAIESAASWRLGSGHGPIDQMARSN